MLLQFLVLTFAGWINRRQLGATEYLLDENRVLKARSGDGAFATPMLNAVDPPEKH